MYKLQYAISSHNYSLKYKLCQIKYGKVKVWLHSLTDSLEGWYASVTFVPHSCVAVMYVEYITFLLLQFRKKKAAGRLGFINIKMCRLRTQRRIK